MCFNCYQKFKRVSDDWHLGLTLISQLTCLVWFGLEQKERVVPGRMCVCGSLHIHAHGLCKKCYEKRRWVRKGDWEGWEKRPV